MRMSGRRVRRVAAATASAAVVALAMLAPGAASAASESSCTSLGAGWLCLYSNVDFTRDYVGMDSALGQLEVRRKRSE